MRRRQIVLARQDADREAAEKRAREQAKAAAIAALQGLSDEDRADVLAQFVKRKRAA